LIIKGNYIGFSLLLLISFGCSNTPAESFSAWYQKLERSASAAASEVQTMNIRSASLSIDTIYRSMQGPYETQLVQFNEDEELLWLTGYKAQVMDAQSGERLSDGFMCHNNLNIAQKEELPWRVKTLGTSTRLFTLTEGQTEVKLPEGFGVPIPANAEMNAISQVLNHNQPKINLEAVHNIELQYLKESELAEPLIPLYQQAVFVTKQVSGPAGEQGQPPVCGVEEPDSSSILGKRPKHVCAIEYSKEEYNPYHDRQGRSFTGHWKIPNGMEVLETDVTRMLNLPYNTTVHYIGVHMHPFAKSLELWDVTADTMLFKAHVKGYEQGIGIEEIDHYSSQQGFEVFADHHYKLRSVYDCTDSLEHHTAMATMFLYLRDL